MSLEKQQSAVSEKRTEKEELVELLLGGQLKNLESEVQSLNQSLAHIDEDLRNQFLSHFQHNAKNSPRKISKALSPIIGSSIANQVKNERGKIIDALYPVMGAMIGKYVKEAIQTNVSQINQKIDQTLSVKSAVRKVKSNFTGISEAELLLSEKNQTNVIGAYLVGQESGHVIVEAHQKKSLDLDSDLFAGALTAIKDFISDCSKNPEQTRDLGLIEFGGSNIVIESAGSYFLALIVEGDVNTSLREKAKILLSKSLSKINMNTSDISPKVQGSIRDMLYEFAIQTTPGEKKASWLKSFFPFLLGLLLIYIVTLFIGKLQAKSLSAKIHQHSEFGIYNVDVNYQWPFSYQLVGLMPDPTSKAELLSYVSKTAHFFDGSLKDQIKVLKPALSPEALFKKFNSKVALFNSAYKSKLKLNVENGVYKISGNMGHKDNESKFIDNIKTLPGTFVYEKQWKTNANRLKDSKK